MHTDPLPPFHRWAAVFEWEDAALGGGATTEDLARRYALLACTPAQVRAALLYHRARMDDQRDEALHRAYGLAHNRLLQLYVLAVSCLTRRGRAMVVLDPDDLTFSDVLLDGLREVRRLEDGDVSRVEVEYRLLEALHYDQYASGDHSSAIVTAKEMLLLATLAQVPRSMATARRYYQSAIAQAGRYHEDLTERQRTLRSLRPDDPARLKERKGLAIAQLNVGDLRGALDTAHAAPQLPIHQTLAQAVVGIFEPDAQNHFVDRGLGWIAECLWHLARIDSVPPWRPLDRRALATAALCIIREHNQRRALTDRAFLAWLEARARLEAGEYGLARHLVQSVAPIDAEDLLTRTLLGGARLDLALTDQAYQTQTVAHSEDELRQIFALARSLRHGSPSGLADILQRWHPRAAAYMALCPQPVPELLGASEAVLKCHRRAEVYGVVLPPAVALDEALRRYDLPTVAERPGSNARFQRQRLLVRRGTLDYWRPVVLAAPLAAALRSVRSGTHDEAAARLDAEFGSVPGQVPVGTEALVEALRLAIAQKDERGTSLLH